MKSKRINNILILLGYCIVCLIGYYSMTDNPSLVSTLFTLSFGWILLLAVLSMESGINYRHFKPQLACVCLSFFNVLILSGIGSFDYYKKIIMFTCFMLLSYVFSNTKHISKSTLFGIFLVNALFSLSYLYVFNEGFAFSEGEYLLTLGFSNPNLAGMFLLNSFLYISLLVIVLYSNYKRKYVCIPFIALAVSLVFLISLTKCRSSIVSVLAFLLLVAWDIIYKGNVKIKRWMVLVWTVFPIAFVFLYTNFISSFDLTMSFDDASKSSTSRNVVWLPALKSLSENWILGDYYGISDGTGMSQMHNTHLDVWCSYGIVPFLFYLIFLYRIVMDSLSQTKSAIQRYSIYAFIVCFVSGTFEASLVAGGAGLYILSCGFLLLANALTDKPLTQV